MTAPQFERPRAKPLRNAFRFLIVAVLSLALLYIKLMGWLLQQAVKILRQESWTNETIRARYGKTAEGPSARTSRDKY